MRKFRILLIGVLYVIQGNAQISDSLLSSSIQYIDREDLKRIVYRLAAPEMEGRMDGTEGIKRASKFITDSFLEYKIDCLPILKGFTQNFSLTSFKISKPLVLFGKRKAVEYSDYFGSVSTMVGYIFKDVIVVQDLSIDHIKTLYPNNKIVLFLTSNIFFPKKELYDLLIRRGCIGVAICNPINKSEFDVLSKMHSTSNIAKREKLKEVFSGSVFKTDSLIKSLKYKDYYLSTIVLNPRFTAKFLGIKENELLQKFSDNTLDIELLNKKKLQIRVTREIIKESGSGANIIGIIKGTENPEEALVISAHYDHLGIENEQVMYGADDNASGVAAVLELAQAYSKAIENGFKPRRTIVFAAFSGEEKGLWGSRAFVNEVESLNIKPIANINLDMIGRGEDRHLEKNRKDKKVYAIAHKRDSLILKQIRLNSSTADSLFIDYSSSDLYSSDQASFVTKNIPAVMFFRGLHNDYHTQRDTPEKLDYQTMERIVRLVFKVSWGYIR